MQQDARPNWKKWKRFRVVKVWQAVALWADIDPDHVHYGPGAVRLSGYPGDWLIGMSNAPAEFTDRLKIAVSHLDHDSLTIIHMIFGKPAEWDITLPSFAALVCRFDDWSCPNELAALTEPDKRDAEILNLKQQVDALTQDRNKLPVEVPIKKSQKQSEAAIERHSKARERTLAAVLATLATADRESYISNTNKTIVVTKLAQLVEDNRTKYEKHGKILSLQEIRNLVGEILNGKYFS